jgi:ADP-heptose:LPS heptosyltransferase
MKVLISSYTGLGNFILKTPLIKFLSKEYLNCQIDLLFGNQWGAENVLKNSRLINKQYWLDSRASVLKKNEMFRKLKKNEYDLVILPFDSSPKFVLYLSLIYLNKAQILGHVNPLSSSLFNRLKIAIYLVLFKINWVPVINGRHEIDLNLDLIQSINQTKLSYEYDTYVCWEKEDLSQFEIPSNYLAIQMSAANGAPTPKIWDPKNFSILISKFLLKYPKFGVVLLGDSGDAENLKIDISLQNPKVINLMGKTSFNQLCNLIDHADIVMAHDSGIMHIANSLKSPLIALYGPTDLTRTGPLSINARVLESKNACWRKSYGFQNGEERLANEFPNYFCMSGILVDQVLGELDKILDKNLNSN